MSDPVAKIVEIVAKKAGAKIGEKLASGIAKAKVTSAQLEAFAQSIDPVALGVEVVHDMTRDDGFAGGSTFGYLRAQADKTVPVGGFIATIAIACYSAFGGKAGKKFWAGKLASWIKNGTFTVGDPPVTYTTVPPGSLGGKLLAGSGDVFENYQASAMNAKALTSLKVPVTPFPNATIDSLAKGVLNGDKISIESGIVLIRADQVAQLAQLVHKPTVAVKQAKAAKQVKAGFVTGQRRDKKGRTQFERHVAKVVEAEADPPPPVIDSEEGIDKGTMALILLGAAGLAVAMKKG